jgi:hypothetical protein
VVDGLARAAEEGHLSACGGVGTTLPFFKNQQICATIYKSGIRDLDTLSNKAETDR